MAKVNWIKSLAALANDYVLHGHQIDAATGRNAARLARDMAAYAKDNHPWTNRTGAAEAGLHGRVIHDHGKHTAIIEHGVDYGIYLELANAGKWGVIDLTLAHFIPAATGLLRDSAQGRG